MSARPLAHARRRIGVVLAAAVLGAVVAALPAVAHADRGTPYRQTNLVSDIPGLAQLTDSNLVNPWGLAFGPNTPAWVADNGMDVATVYQGARHKQPISNTGLVVSIPGGEPTGEVFNPTGDFVVHSGMSSGASKFIFASESGNITGWSPAVPPPQFSTQAQLGRNVPTAVFKGLALAFPGGSPHLYATDFHNNRIDVFDSSFTPVTLSGNFTDPNLPAHFAPFGIQSVGNELLVSYAMQDADAHDDVPGLGNGFVDVFTTDGHFVRRLISGGVLDSPWGMAIAPSGFGAFSHALLVGNFGNGFIHAYDPRSGRFLGTLQGKHGPIFIDGLWALKFGNEVTGGTRTLLFTAGLNGENDGLFGKLTVGNGGH